MKTKVTWVITICALLVGMSAPARAGGETLMRMSGTISGENVVDAACGGFHNTSAGTFTGVPFGRAEWTSQTCIDLVADPGAYTIRDGRFVLKTRAGSISGTYEARGGQAGLSRHTYVWGTFTVTRGTGIYKRVRGKGLLGADVSDSERFELAGSLTSFPRR